MRIFIASLLGTFIFTPAAMAAPLKKSVKEGPITATATMVAADRSGQREWPKITVESSHRKDDYNVKGRVEMYDKDMNPIKECAFEVFVAAAGKEVVDLRDCAAPVAEGLQIWIDSAEAAPAPAPEPEPEPETPGDGE